MVLEWLPLTTTTTTMLDLHEAMRGLRFAPEALAVLDSNRQVRVLSRQMERLFGVPAADIVGRSTNHLWAEESRTAFMLALNEAAQRIGRADTAAPVIRRLKTQRALVDMSVAAWHPTDDPMYATPRTPTTAPPAPQPIIIHECFYTISLRDVGSPRRSQRQGHKHHEPRSSIESQASDVPREEAISSAERSPRLLPRTDASDVPQAAPSQPQPNANGYIPPHTQADTHTSQTNNIPPALLQNISLLAPRRSSSSLAHSSCSPPPLTTVEILRDGVIDSLDAAAIVLSADGMIAVRNQHWADLAGGGEAGVMLLSERKESSGDISNAPPPPNSDAPLPPPAAWKWHPSLVITDLEFTRPIKPDSHPLYRAAMLGHVVNEFRCGGVKIGSGEDTYPHNSTEARIFPPNGRANLYSAPKPGVGDTSVEYSPTHTERPESVTSETSTLKPLSPAETLAPLPSETQGTSMPVNSYFPEDAKFLYARMSPASPPSEFNLAWKTRLASEVPEGERLILEVSARPIRDARGELVGGMMTVRDVTQREKERVESVKNESNTPDMRLFATASLDESTGWVPYLL
ncbi:Multi-sensor hybrid histidine kinase [Ceratobasidium theobromae]|uniref:Multi-sensor hybrid histidine kinase n=1 Tax=Ceratobasidium theobromae TaxID=1582974 RepID=A0A5N5QE11_9AGAM|nr:Multi-sensor hybrid histidine kinase [Ceratobasidium theobromae]